MNCVPRAARSRAGGREAVPDSAIHPALRVARPAVDPQGLYRNGRLRRAPPCWRPSCDNAEACNAGVGCSVYAVGFQAQFCPCSGTNLGIWAEPGVGLLVLEPLGATGRVGPAATRATAWAPHERACLAFIPRAFINRMWTLVHLFDLTKAQTQP